MPPQFNFVVFYFFITFGMDFCSWVKSLGRDHVMERDHTLNIIIVNHVIAI